MQRSMLCLYAATLAIEGLLQRQKNQQLSAGTLMMADESVRICYRLCMHAPQDSLLPDIS